MKIETVRFIHTIDAPNVRGRQTISAGSKDDREFSCDLAMIEGIPFVRVRFRGEAPVAVPMHNVAHLIFANPRGKKTAGPL
jgi:hypothetical protein